MIRRCFFQISNKEDIDTNNRFTEVYRPQFIQFTQKMCPGIISQDQAGKIYDKITHNKEKSTMTFYDFLEGIRLIAINFYKYKQQKEMELSST